MADIEALLAELTLEEKAALTAGEGMLTTTAVERVGIPKIHVTDGPNGTRGLSYPGIGGPAALCTPCGSAMGATWDPGLVERLGALLGREALDRGCRGLLAPTVNLHRSPLGGRNFECFSEDPLLSGRLAAAYVRGVQSNGVFATVKHFVGNDAEFERSSISSVIDERTLRELYLVPFELAVREGGVLGLMTGYNRLNGRWVTEQPALLVDVLRSEWKFEGLVMTDWYGVADSRHSLAAGLDLEMPGPGRAFGHRLVDLVGDGTVPETDVDAAVRRLLGGLDRIGALDGPPPPICPRLPGAEELALIRQAATDATVLLANDGILPLQLDRLSRLAVIGDHAARPRIQGGGSAGVIPHRPVSPLEALRAVLGDDVDIVFERGAEVDRSAPLVGRSVLRAPDGFAVEVHAGPGGEGDVVHRTRIEELHLFVLGAMSPQFPDGDWSGRVSGTVVAEEDGELQLVLSQAGKARVLVDGDVVLDGSAEGAPSRPGDFLFGTATQELVATRRFTAGVPVDVTVEYDRAGATIPSVRLGSRTLDAGALIDRAARAAATADAAVVFVGTTEAWETEGRDRPMFELPGRQDELIERVAAANPRTVVVVNAGSPVGMPWAGDVAAILQPWFGGEQMGAAVADILIGRSEPGGRLPTTIPAHLANNPSYDNFPGENGQLRYGEGLFMGYRGYEHRRIAPRYPFGFGLGYTTFELGDPQLSAVTFEPGDRLTVAVPVRNVGPRPGSAVVQCYVAPLSPRLARPPKELKAFAKVQLEPAESTTVELELVDRSFAYWDPGQPDWTIVTGHFSPEMAASGQVRVQDRRQPGWQVDPGRYEIVIGRSSADITGRAVVEIPGRAAAGE